MNESVQEGNGQVKIADEVVATIAGVAAMEVTGVAGMSGGIVGGITEMLGRRSLQKGVRVTVTGQVAVIDTYLVVYYGVRIPDVAQKVQEVVKKAVDSMTGLIVSEVNIHIQGVTADKPAKVEEAQ